MKSKNIKIIDEHNIDRDANVMFALELEGSEYVVYWVSRDEESNNVFVSKVLKNIDGTSNMLDIDDEEKRKEIAEIVKTLVSSAVTDQNDKMPGVSMALSNGKTIKFINVSFNKEQHINVTKTYITTVKKEVTKVAETYYDVVAEEAKVEPVLTASPVIEPIAEIFPETPVVASPVVATPIVEPVTTVVTPQPVLDVTPTPVVTPAPVLVEPTPVVVETPVVQPAQTVVIPQPIPVAVQPAPVVEQPTVVASPVVEPAMVIPQPVPAAVLETPIVAAPVTEQPLVFNASKETNLNQALGEVANSASIPVEDINSVREFGVETPVVAQQPAVVAAPVVGSVPPAVAPMVQPAVAEIPKTLTKKAGFANSKFFMVVAIAFFIASCVFLGYEVFNYFQLVK